MACRFWASGHSSIPCLFQPLQRICRFHSPSLYRKQIPPLVSKTGACLHTLPIIVAKASMLCVLDGTAPAMRQKPRHQERCPRNIYLAPRKTNAAQDVLYGAKPIKRSAEPKMFSGRWLPGVWLACSSLARTLSAAPQYCCLHCLCRWLHSHQSCCTHF